VIADCARTTTTAGRTACSNAHPCTPPRGVGHDRAPGCRMTAAARLRMAGCRGERPATIAASRSRPRRSACDEGRAHAATSPHVPTRPTPTVPSDSDPPTLTLHPARSPAPAPWAAWPHRREELSQGRAEPPASGQSGRKPTDAGDATYMAMHTRAYQLRGCSSTARSSPGWMLLREWNGGLLRG
jgi:hypothetical protein